MWPFLVFTATIAVIALIVALWKIRQYNITVRGFPNRVEGGEHIILTEVSDSQSYNRQLDSVQSIKGIITSRYYPY